MRLTEPMAALTTEVTLKRDKAFFAYRMSFDKSTSLTGGQGAKPPEAEKLFAFRRPLEAANLPLFSLYWRLSKYLKFLIQH